MMRPTFFSIGFRPFFASGMLFSALALFIWAGFWQLDSQNWITNNMDPVGGFLFWHPHELIMGFALAIILGFLLTATRNWTGLETATSLGLFLLWLLWLLARFVMAFGFGLSFNIILTSQIVVPLLGAIFIARPIIKKRMWRNLFAPSILIIFAILDATMLYQIQQTGLIPSRLLEANILLIIIMISMIGGRIIPLFTANKLGIQKANEPKPVFLAALLPLIALVLIRLLPDNSLTLIITNSCAALLFLAHIKRLVIWYHPNIWRHPMLWSLWVFYGTIPLAFFAMAASPILSTWMKVSSIPLHILAIGSICGLIISMVSRVSLGHTGRVILHDKTILLAFVLIIISLILRTFIIAVFGLSSQLITSSAVLAGFSCLLIFIRFINAWLTPRPDGK